MAISSATIRFADPAQFASHPRSKLRRHHAALIVICQAQQQQPLAERNNSHGSSPTRTTRRIAGPGSDELEGVVMMMKKEKISRRGRSIGAEQLGELYPNGLSPEPAPAPNFLLDLDLSFGGEPEIEILGSKGDCYDGVLIDPTRLPLDPHQFVARLRASLGHWRAQGKRGVWLELPSHLAEFVPLAIKEGFQYHHAEPSHVMMTYWLPDRPSTLPPNASHQVGIGAFIMNDRRQVLAVQEKTGPLRGLGVWKMPTGLINEGEDLCDGAVREVKEETGVDTKFMQVVGFRHGHLVSFRKSDLYFMCTLQPLSEDIRIEQDCEIEAAKWIPLEEFQSQDFFMESEARRKMLELCVASCDGGYRGFKAEELFSGSLARPTHYFYAQ